ncbi:TfuA-like protein [Rhizobium sp. GCM10022189]|uniref:TfuA-like protein n=1 Tax=Rhizobium sp. GCM10022189 TaxID=3252654 RepID=UPI000DD51144
MKVVFIGPSLPDAASHARAGIVLRPPAVQGDVLRAVEDGADVIGLVDGGFENTAPVWHKEILFALSLNVTVFGAASMGALRAAECRAFGMIGVGRIFNDYVSGAIDNDADVALLHEPIEMGGRPLTVPMVNVRSTLDEMERLRLFDKTLRLALEQTAAGLFFKKRSWSLIVHACAAIPESQRQYWLNMLKTHAIDQKRIDALALLDAVGDADDRRKPINRHWEFRETTLWSEQLARSKA